MIFIYSGIFSYSRANHPIKSNYTQITGKPSISTGLSRSFSAIIKLEFKKAREFNPYGISVFTFFLIQLCLRLFFYMMLKRSLYELKIILILDAVISTTLFILHFEPFIKDLVHR